MTYVHIIKLNKERNIYLSITTPPPHTILHMHIRNYKESLTMKEDKSTLLVYLLISMSRCLSTVLPDRSDTPIHRGGSVLPKSAIFVGKSR